MSFLIWMIAALAASAYCFVRGLIDLRRKHYVWGAIGVVSSAIFLLTPVPEHAVQVTMPIPKAR